MRLLFLFGRLIVGGFYIYTGLNHFLKFGAMTDYAKYKGVPLAAVAVAGSGLLLIFAGVALLLGIYPELAVAALVVFFVPVSFKMHNFWAVAAEQKPAEMINFMKNASLMGSALMFLMIKKPWPLSLNTGKK